MTTTDRPLSTPAIHLNGTGARALIDERLVALNALRVARNAVADITIHPRDFPQPDGYTRYEAACAERTAQIAALDRIHDEIEAVTSNLIDQQIARGPL